MKELGVVFRWGRVIPGKEKEAVEFFAETTKYFADKLASGEITFFEPFLFATADAEIERGMFVIKGVPEKIYALLEERKGLELTARSYQMLAHVRRDLMFVGEEVLAQVQLFAEANLGLVPA